MKNKDLPAKFKFNVVFELVCSNDGGSIRLDTTAITHDVLNAFFSMDNLHALLVEALAGMADQC